MGIVRDLIILVVLVIVVGAIVLFTSRALGVDVSSSTINGNFGINLVPTTTTPATNFSAQDTNSSNFWDNLDTPIDINAGDITDDNTYVEVAGDTMTGTLNHGDSSSPQLSVWFNNGLPSNFNITIGKNGQQWNGITSSFNNPFDTPVSQLFRFTPGGIEMNKDTSIRITNNTQLLANYYWQQTVDNNADYIYLKDGSTQVCSLDYDDEELQCLDGAFSNNIDTPKINKITKQNVSLFEDNEYGEQEAGNYLNIYRDNTGGGRESMGFLGIDKYDRFEIGIKNRAMIFTLDVGKILTLVGIEFKDTGSTSEFLAKANDLEVGWDRNGAGISQDIKFAGNNDDGEHLYFNVGGLNGARVTNFWSEFTNFNGTTNNFTGNVAVAGNITGNQIYGGMYYHNHTGTTKTFTNANTWYPLYFTNADSLNGFSYVGGFGLSSNLTALVSGKYQVTYTGIGSGQNNHVYLSTILIDGVAQEKCGNHHKMSSGGDVITQSGVCLIDLVAGQTISVATQDLGGTGDGEYYGGNLNLIRVGN